MGKKCCDLFLSRGEYHRAAAKVAVKIVDMLGEEVVEVA